MADQESGLVVTPIPPLVDVLSIKEREKGAPLTEAEVLDIRDKAVCVALPASERAAMDKARGYADLDPDNVWEHWQEVRQLPSQDG